MSHERLPSSRPGEGGPPPLWMRVPSRVGDVLALVSGVLILGLMFLTVADVALRKFFASGVPGAVELNEVMLVAVVFLALMAAEMTDTNVRTPLLTERLPDRWANLAHVIGYLPAIAFLGWATYVTGIEGIDSWLRGDFRFGLIFVPIWPAKLVVPIGLAGLTVAVVIKFVQALVNLITARPAVIAEHESVL